MPSSHSFQIKRTNIGSTNNQASRMIDGSSFVKDHKLHQIKFSSFTLDGDNYQLMIMFDFF